MLRGLLILFLRGERDRPFIWIHAIAGVPTGQASRRQLVRHSISVFFHHCEFYSAAQLKQLRGSNGTWVSQGICHQLGITASILAVSSYTTVSPREIARMTGSSRSLNCGHHFCAQTDHCRPSLQPIPAFRQRNGTDTGSTELEPHNSHTARIMST